MVNLKTGDNEFGLSVDDDPDDRDLVDELLLRVFNLLKGSGFINDIIRMSLTDPRVRLGMIDMTIRLLNAEVIPWDDIFLALKRHGLAIDVIKFTLLMLKQELDWLHLLLNCCLLW